MKLVSFAQELKVRVAAPHDLMPRGRVFGAAEVAAEVR
jgi:hypothetical protein